MSHPLIQRLSPFRYKLINRFLYMGVYFFIIFSISCLAGTHVKVSNFKKIESDIVHKWGEDLENVLIAIDIDRTSIDIDSQDNAFIIDPYLSKFIYFVSKKGAKVLFLTARFYDEGNNEWAIKDLSTIDSGKTLSYLKERWQSYFEQNKNFKSDPFIKFDYVTANLQSQTKGNYLQRDNKWPVSKYYNSQFQINDSLFQEAILFSRASKQDSFKGLCLKKFLKIAGLNHISKVVLIDDDEGYLDEFQEAFSANNTNTPVETLTYHFIP